MSKPRRIQIASVLSAAALVALMAAPAQADVGVEKASRHAAKPGARVTVTVACGCFPPCKGAPGHRNEPCTLGTKKEPPAAFPVSLVPLRKAPRPHRCGPNGLCPPKVKAPPAHAPFTYLGEALPEGRAGGGLPKYGLDFEVPDLRPGLYTYVIYSEVDNRGASGRLIADPLARQWRLRIR